MKFIKLLSAILLVCTVKAFSQSTAISDVTHSPVPSAVLDVYSTSKGMLVPRMTNAEKLAISSPATGLLIYQTDDTAGFTYYNGSTWTNIITNTAGWIPGGNTVASTQVIGTVTNFDLPFVTSNTERMRLTNTGCLGIGSVAFNATSPEKLLVDYGTTTSNTLATFRGGINDYLQVNIQNTNSGNTASTDFVATADNGTDSTYYIDMGINSSTYSPGVDNFGGPNDGYLYSSSRNLLIGTASTNSDVIFLASGGQINTNQALRIDGATKNIIVGRKEGATTAPVGNTLRGPNAGGTNLNGGDLTVQGGRASGTGTGGSLNLIGGGTISGSNGPVNINVSSNNATNINTGTSTQNVTIGNSSNNILLPKFTTVGAVYYNSSTGGQLANASLLFWDNTNTRLGVNNTSPNSTFAVIGSHSSSSYIGSGNYTVLSTDYIIINTGAAATWTLPSPATCVGRVYYLVNQGTGVITLSPGIKRSNSATLDTSLGSAAASNTEQIMSDGTYWRQISN